jgi:tetrahydromethanopterin S-methyltransferase subunit H
MISFSKEQTVLEIGDVKLGGQPGEHATVLFGTVFYGKKYREPTPEALSEVRTIIRRQEEFSQLTGNPGIVDIFIDKEENIGPRISLVLEELPPKRPFSADVPESKVREAVLKYAKETGISDRLILNSFNLAASEGELAALKDFPPGTAILLGYNPKDFSTDGRVDMLDTGAGYLDKGILEYAREFGLKNTLLDTGATPFDHNAAETLRAIPVMKNKWGLPVGCAIHNTVESWLWLKEYRKEHAQVYEACDAGSNMLPILMGANYCVYGPMRNAGMAFPMAAMADKFVAEGAEDYFGISQPENHPRRKLG